MANLQKINETFDFIEKLAPGQFNMGFYGVDDPDCGTIACLAGWRAHMDGHNPAAMTPRDVFAHAEEAFELTHDQARAIFLATYVYNVAQLRRRVESVLANRTMMETP